MRSGTPPDSTYLTDNQDKSQRRRGRLPFEVPESIARHTVTVTNPEDILSQVQEDREQRFHSLVRRYISQIQYGCQNPQCPTPTCLSYQKRTAKAPLRRYTALSARTLACFLASEKDPEAALCPNQPVVVSDSVSPRRGSRASEKHSKKSQYHGPRQPHGHPTHAVADRHNASSTVDRIAETREYQKESSNASSAVVNRGSSTAGPPDINSESNRNDHDSQVNTPDKDNGRPNKDPKSFTQSLFDTLPLKMLEWIPLRQRRALVDSPASPTLLHLSEDKSAPVKVPESRSHTSYHSKGEAEINSTDPHSRSRGIANGHAKESLRKPRLQQAQRSEKRMEDGKISKPRFTKGIVLDKTDSEVEDTSSNSSGASEVTSRSYPSAPRLSANAPPTTYDTSKQDFPINFDSVDHGSEGPTNSFNNHANGTILKEPAHPDPQTALVVSFPTTDDLRFSEPAPETGYQTESISESENPTEEVESLSLISAQILAELFTLHRKYHLAQNLDSAARHPRQSHQNMMDFIKQSVFFVLKDPFRLARSFSTTTKEDRDKRSSHTALQIHAVDMLQCFNILYMVVPHKDILLDLWYAVDHVNTPPPGILPQSLRHKHKDHKQKPVRSKPVDHGTGPETQRSHLTDDQAAYVCVVGLYALARMAFPSPANDSERQMSRAMFSMIRASGEIFPVPLFDRLEDGVNQTRVIHHILNLTDLFADPHALRLVQGIVNAVNNRLAYWEISRARALRSQLSETSKKKNVNILQMIVQHLQDYTAQKPIDPSWKFHLPMMTLEWLRVIMLKEWNGKPLSRRASTFGGVVQILAAMYESRATLGLWPYHFYTPLFSEKLDTMEMPVEWLGLHRDNKSIHLLSYSFLFPPSALVTYFRALNFATMSGSFENALVIQRDMRQFGSSHEIPVANTPELINVMRPAMAICLVLTVRRDNVLGDAIDQIWRRQKRELMRPLKVRMGMDEGEEGIDHGGVQQEFFRVLFGQALEPAYGMFSIDERTRMAFFRPGSLEPQFKFEVLGVLMSIAVYNSITLPVTFPTAFYRKLLGLKVKKLAHIADGWPDLAKGLQSLLDWSESDVGDIFMRTYEFSYEAFGTHVDIDMEKVSREAPWPPPKQKKGKDKAKMASFELPPSREISPTRATSYTSTTDGGPSCSPVFPGSESQRRPPTDSEGAVTESSAKADEPGIEASLVTNENREQFVKDYIFWLTDKSIRAQYEAFAKGFYTCLDRKALSIFTPEALKSVVEGIQEIDIDGLERVAKYEDGYEADSDIITNFWEVVRAFSPEKRRQLLEFVTASDRVPVNGVGSIMFIVQRNGIDDHRLPTSMTCFGRLLLPHYSSKEVLEEKLTKAIENAKGFGVA